MKVREVSLKELNKILEKIPNANEKLPVQIEIVTKDFIFQKDSKGDIGHKYNRKMKVFPFWSNLKFKNKINASDIINLKFTQKQKINLVVTSILYFLADYYLLISFVILYYATAALMIALSIASLSFIIFLLWSLLFPLIGIVFASKDLFATNKYLILIKAQNQVGNMIIPNSLLKAFSYLWQFIYLLILMWYNAISSISINLGNFILYFIYVIISFFFGLFYLGLNIKYYSKNKKIKVKVLDFLYPLIQDDTISPNLQNSFIKIISDMEKAKLIDLESFMKMIYLLSVLIAILPRILNI